MPAAPTRYGRRDADVLEEHAGQRRADDAGQRAHRLLHAEGLTPLLLAGPVGDQRGDRRAWPSPGRARAGRGRGRARASCRATASSTRPPMLSAQRDAQQPQLAEAVDGWGDQPALDDDEHDADHHEHGGDRALVEAEAVLAEQRERGLEAGEGRRGHEHDDGEREQRMAARRGDGRWLGGLRRLGRRACRATGGLPCAGRAGSRARG